MSENMYKTTGEFTPDKLIADNAIPVTAKGVKIAAGQGKLVRGTLLGFCEDGSYKVTGSADGENTVGADCILTTDMDATELEAVTTAYVTGTFNKSAIILAEGAEIGTYETELRKLGIYLKTVQEY